MPKEISLGRIDGSVKLFCDGNTTGNIYSESEIKDILRNLQIRQIANLLKEDDYVDPTKSQLYAMAHAAHYVNTLSKKIGLPELPLSEFDWCMIKSSRFKELLNLLYGTFDGDGLCIGLVPHSFLSDLQLFEGIKASAFLHEWIHVYFEMISMKYKVQPEEEKMMWNWAQVRRGLVVMSPERSRSHLLNEFANYYFQFEFLREFLHEQKENPNFTKEIQYREEVLETCFSDFKKEKFVSILFQRETNSREEFPYRVNKDNLFFTEEGAMSSNLVLTKQLVDDLADWIGPINGEHFAYALLRAKLDPHYQNEIRKVVDQKIAKGAYSTLRNLAYQPEEITRFLALIQSMKYGSLGSLKPVRPSSFVIR